MPKSKNSLIGALMVVALVGGVMVAAYVVNTPDAQKVRDDLRKQPQNSAPAVTTSVNEGFAHTFHPRMDGTDLVFDKRPVDVPAGEDAKVIVVNTFLEESDIVPAEARLLGVDVRSGVAYLDFNQAFDHTYGTDDERILVNGILALMGQFPGITKVQFSIGGSPMETLGNIDLSEPQRVVKLDEKNRPITEPVVEEAQPNPEGP